MCHIVPQAQPDAAALEVLCVLVVSYTLIFKIQQFVHLFAHKRLLLMFLKTFFKFGAPASSLSIQTCIAAGCPPSGLTTSCGVFR